MRIPTASLALAFGLSVWISSLSALVPSAHAEKSTTVKGEVGVTAEAKKWQAEEWLVKRTSPWLLPGDKVEKKKYKGPIRTIAKGAAKEVGTSLHRMGQDMVLVFSCQDDLDPYDKSAPPSNKPAIVLKFNLVDGTSCYLRRFPDGSYIMEDGFIDGTLILPESQGTYVVKYPNGGVGKLIRKTSGTIEVHRPDKTVTVFAKTASGGYSARNDSVGYMGEARPDRTGIHYELGDWK